MDLLFILHSNWLWTEMFSHYTHYLYTISFFLDVNKRPPSRLPTFTFELVIEVAGLSLPLPDGQCANDTPVIGRPLTRRQLVGWIGPHNLYISYADPITVEQNQIDACA